MLFTKQLEEVLLVPPKPKILMTDGRAGGAWATAASYTRTGQVTPGTELLIAFGMTRAAAAARTATSITWNGASMTEILDIQDPGNRSGVSCYYLFDPIPAASANMVLTMSGNCTGLALFYLCLTGVARKNPTVITSSSANTSSSHTLTGTKTRPNSLAFQVSSIASNAGAGATGNVSYGGQFEEIYDAGDTGADGNRAGVAYSRFSPVGGISSTCTSVTNENFGWTSGLIEVFAKGDPV